jgi:hypothetical protein
VSLRKPRARLWVHESGYWEVIALDVGQAGNGGVRVLLHALASSAELTPPEQPTTKTTACDLTDGAVGLRTVHDPAASIDTVRAKY